jgi:hypothetical protein
MTPVMGTIEDLHTFSRYLMIEDTPGFPGENLN